MKQKQKLLRDNIPRIAITPGEPAGIGPDLVLQVAQQNFPAELIIIADRELLKQRTQKLKIKIQFENFNPAQKPVAHQPNHLKVHHIPLIEPAVPGKLNKVNSAYVIETLKIAAQGCLEKKFAALVTGPVHKGIINDAGIFFSGHTEFFAQLTHTEKVVMMLAAKKLRIALVTTHLPLAQVPQAVTVENVEKTLKILHYDLQKRFGIAQPRILVAGLNPHAGENGHLGREEINVITPVLEKLRKQNMELEGPLPADTIFLPKNIEQADAILAMYHDQGLPVLKFYGFDEAVNITLGLPFIRTSVDHGTALELAGTGKANAGSLMAAINTAIDLSESFYRNG